MLQVIGMCLLVMLVLPYLSYGENAKRQDVSQPSGQSVCLANLRLGVACESQPETHQAMVLVRGQLLALPSKDH